LPENIRLKNIANPIPAFRILRKSPKLPSDRKNPEQQIRIAFAEDIEHRLNYPALRSPMYLRVNAV
jgi:hypothetical protein